MLPAGAAAWTVDGLARVTDAGHLALGGRVVALAGVDIPTFDRTCRQAITPLRCGPRAVLILDAKVSGFVHCEITAGAASGCSRGAAPSPAGASLTIA
jgi:hypothetical protein